MKILDWYILKRYLGTFGVLILLFIPIGIVVDLSEKVDKMIDQEAPIDAILIYYLDFTVYFANLLFPILLFISIIWFTSKLANNTEVIAFLSSGVSFTRFLRPYLIGATIVCIVALLFSLYLFPNASKGYNEFKYAYLKKNRDSRITKDVYTQINDNEFIYATNFRPDKKSAQNFTLEHFEGEELKFKISARSINYIDSTYVLNNYVRRDIGKREDSFVRESSFDTILPFDIEALTPVNYIAETLNYTELNDFIEQEKKKGSGLINTYKVVSYKRWSIPISAFILTIIAVSVSAMKRRGGMGINLAIGIVIAFGYIFMDKIFGTIAEKSTFSPLLAVWFSNIVFSILAVYLLRKAKR
ncbi:MAG: LptF/LptG family permease [Psychroflexus sp.]|nr:LptF/LptG family permease [Psychroflexus sp.]MDN6309136.1 LptF/LptG family permease [Psychroflexus sp.]